jgi:hypothetical protein
MIPTEPWWMLCSRERGGIVVGLFYGDHEGGRRHLGREGPS